MEEKIYILLYYKFQPISNPEEFAREHKEFCDKIGILGKVLVATEGFNGSVSGTKEQMETYKQFVHAIPGFEDVVFKEEQSVDHPFTKMIVRVKEEIVALKKGEIDTTDGGTYLKPEEFMKMYESEKEDIILIDTRNDYEYKVGRFKGAINPNTRTFREFPDFVDTIKDKKDKKVVMYCTGGIRCEKASAYMKQEGFEEVYQLDGGVITYIQNLPNTLWKGKMFVFDKRLVSDVGQEGSPISHCKLCEVESSLYRNCKNPSCDALEIMCVPCQEKYHGCCSEECMKEFFAYARERAAKKQKITA